jgi:hypothetical protein
VKVICAWCLEEGKPAVVREKEPLDDPEDTHGVCAEHKEKLRDPLLSTEVPAPGAGAVRQAGEHGRSAREKADHVLMGSRTRR